MSRSNKFKIYNDVITTITDNTRGRAQSWTPVKRELTETDINLEEDEENMFIYITAGESLNKNNLVSFYNNTAIKSHYALPNRSAFLGIADGNVSAGQQVKVYTLGTYISSITLPNGRLWMGADGAAISTMPTSGMVVEIGMVIDSNKVLIRPGVSIVQDHLI